MSENGVLNALFLCTRNSGRSIMAEAILNRAGKGKVRGFSAGSHPRGEINPLTLNILRDAGLPVDGLRSKSWDEFAGPDAPQLDFVFTVCDDAANEPCPVWPGHPISAHFGVPDPERAQGTEAEKLLAFAEAYRALDHRIGAFVSLPLASLDQMSLRNHLHEIGASKGTGA